MLNLLNRYAHGYIATPVIIALRGHDVFDLLRSGLAVDDLAEHTQANRGQLSVALRLLESLGWYMRDDAGRIRLTDAGAAHEQVPIKLASLYDVPIGDSWLRQVGHSGLQELIAHLDQRWDIADERLADMVDGSLLVPLLLSIRAETPSRYLDLVQLLFQRKGWATGIADDFKLSTMGETVMDSIQITGTVASYRPMLAKMNELIFGDSAAVFSPGSDGYESHLDRSLNIASSAFQHDRYFTDLEELVIAVFEGHNFERQPRYIADMGCGDGTLLRRIYERICNDSERGKVLDEFPLTLIGVDYNKASLQATTRTLADLPHIVLHGDVGDPQRLISDLQLHGPIDPDHILHVRSFLDHDRPFQKPEDPAAAMQRSVQSLNGVFTQRNGSDIKEYDVLQSLVEHLRRWAEIAGAFGLVVLEVHSQTPDVVHDFLDESENLHYDAFHGFSGQFLVGPDQFLMAAAEAGLFPERNSPCRYPKLLPFTRITLSHLQPRRYIVRHARPDDITPLCQLESDCWAEQLRATPQQISRRIVRCPQGQFVLEANDEIVGVLYSQRIENPQSLETASATNAEQLHTPKGTFAQLITINVTPSQQHSGLGDQLLEFVLQVLSVRSGIEKVVGVTRCREFEKHSMSMQEYIHAQTEAGEPLDPILRFHGSHGAEIMKLIPAYRPADGANQGNGVLIEYDVRRRKVRQTTRDAICDTMAKTHDIIGAIVRSTILELLGTDDSNYSPTESLLDLGLDSMSMLELRTVLGRHFGEELESTFLFEYDTADAIIHYFSR